MGIRDVNVFALYGERKNTGDISAPFFPTNGTQLFVASIGYDGGSASPALSGYGITFASGTTATNSTTIATGSPVTAGQTTITLTSASGYVVGGYMQVDVNNTTTPTTAEVRKVVSVASNVVTVDTAFTFSHLAGATVTFASVVGQTPLFSHQILPGNTLPSMTVEKNIGGYQSLQFTGSRVGKYGLKVGAGDSSADFTASLISKGVNVLNTPSSPISVVNESPFVFAEATLTAFGDTISQVSNIGLDVENGLKPTYTFNGNHDLQFLTPLTRKITGQMAVVFDSLNDADWGYYSKMQNQIQGSLTLSLVHPTTPGAGITISLNQINIAKYADDIKLEDVIMSTLDFEASYALGANPPASISAVVTNGTWLPY